MWGSVGGFKSLLFGNLISVVIIFEILTKLYISNFRNNKNSNISFDNKKDIILTNENVKGDNKSKPNKIVYKNSEGNDIEIDIDYIESNSVQSDMDNIYMNPSDNIFEIDYIKEEYTNNPNNVKFELTKNEFQENYDMEANNEIYWKYLFKNLGITLKDFMELIYEFVSTQKNDENINRTLDYDVLILFYQIHAYYFYKGFLVKQSYQKSIEIMEDTFKSGKSIKCYRKIFYYLAKSYKKIGNMDKYNFYMKKSFDIYILLSEFPYHHFIVAKIFLHGIQDVTKNLDYAIHFFKMGFNYNDNNFFINVLYSQKCHKYLLRNNEIVSFINNSVLSSSKVIIDNLVDSETICIICYANFRQVRHSKCKHKLICLLCYEKMQNKNQCPFCKQISEADNEFEI